MLVLGVLELMWPTTRPRRSRRARSEPGPSRPILAAPARPAQSILPRRLIDSPSASRPSGGFVFPPPADYVPPPLPREEVRPIRPAERGDPAPSRFEPVARLAEPEASPIEDERSLADAPEPLVVEHESRPLEQVASPREPVEPPEEALAPPLLRRRSKISPHARPHRVLRPGKSEQQGSEQSPTVADTAAPSGPLDTETRIKRDSPVVERC